MFGFIIGTACLIGLVVLLRGQLHPAFAHRCGGATRWRHRDGSGGGPPLSWLFRRLQTDPEQESVIREAVNGVREGAREVHARVRESRGDVAKAMRGNQLDADAMGVVTERVDEALGKLRGEVLAGLARVHGVLRPEQRSRLADWISALPDRNDRHGGPYRSWPW